MNEPARNPNPPLSPAALLARATTRALSEHGLPAALQTLADLLTPDAHSVNATITLELDDRARSLAHEEAFVLQTVAREALTNAIQHSNATEIRLNLSVQDRAIILTITDNGIGLPNNSNQAISQHHGLLSLRALIHTLHGATLRIETLPNKTGTRVRATMPFAHHDQLIEHPFPDRQTAGLVTIAADEEIRALIADDAPLVRQGLRQAIAAIPNTTVVAEAATGIEVIAFAEAFRPHLIILDIQMPLLNGLHAASMIRQRLSPSPLIIVISAYWDEVCIRHAHEIHASAFLRKTTHLDQVRAAVLSVLAGNIVYDPQIEAILTQQHRTQTGQFIYANHAIDLTPVEHQILTHLMTPASFDDIARQTNLSRGTINTHTHHIYNKLGVNSRTDAILIALRTGLLRLTDDLPLP